MKRNPFEPDNMYKGASVPIFSNAKKLRENATKAEELLWLALKIIRWRVINLGDSIR